MAGEGLVVEGHQAALAHGGGGLQGLHLAGALGMAQGVAAQTHGPTGDQGHGFTPLPQATEAGGQIGDHLLGAA